MKKKIVTKALVALLGGAILITAASAHSESTGNAEADHRIAEMKKLGANMGAIAKVAKGEMAYDAKLNDNARAIAAIAGNMGKLFPEGSGVESSRAKPEIWDPKNKEKFEMNILNLQKASINLVVAVESGQQSEIGAALKEAGGACGACHKQFRKPKKK